MKVALCAIAKLENHYIREWVEYYKRIGFDAIYLYDNNEPDGEHFDEVIENYMRCGFVHVIDFRGRKVCQLDAYNDCYKRFGRKYDWMAFFDIDEFLTILNPYYKRDVKRFLDSWLYDDFDIIKICWQCMTDSGLLTADGNYSVKRFTQVSSPAAGCANNRNAKCICRTNKPLVWKRSVHVPDGERWSICDATGTQTNARNGFEKPIWREAVIKHYRFKTLEEYITTKMQRLYPDQEPEQAAQKLDLNFFFKVNERTPEKEELADKLLKQYK